MIKTRVILPAALVLMVSGYAQSDELTDAAQALCDSVKSCALEQVSREDLTEEMREMMGPVLDNMCENMRNQVKDLPVGHALYQPAVGCMRSMVSLDCEQMQNPEGVKTPECTEYDKLAKEAAAPAATPQ